MTRLIAINALIRVAAAGSGQLFAFLLAERFAGRTATGALLVGTIGAAFFVTELLGAPYAGRMADKYGQLRILRTGPVFGVVSALVAAAVAVGAPGVMLLAGILFLARLNEGASAACAVPTTLALISRGTDGDPRRRTRVMGAFEISSMLGMISGFVIVGVAWDSIGAWAFLLLPPFYALAWYLVGRLESGNVVVDAESEYENYDDEDQERDEGNDEGNDEGRVEGEPPAVLSTLRLVARRPGAVAFGVAWLSVNAVVGLWIQQAPFLLSLPERSAEQALVGGFSGQQIGIIFAVWGLAFLLGIGLWVWLAPGWPRRRAMTVALVGMIGVVAALTAVNHGGHNLFLWVGVVFVLVESGFTPAAFAHLAELTRPLDATRGTAMGLYSVLLGTGQLVGNLLGGLFSAKWQMDGVLLLTAILAVIAFIGVLKSEEAELS
ncbi:MAG: MFS transporter [Rhodothermia bacterium]